MTSHANQEYHYFLKKAGVPHPSPEKNPHLALPNSPKYLAIDQKPSSATH